MAGEGPVSLVEHFSVLVDERDPSKVRHLLIDMLGSLVLLPDAKPCSLDSRAL
jgi:hypothetical protein